MSLKNIIIGGRTMVYVIPDKKMELYHHGILGQKWGKKNGPPYPLDAEDHSAAEKKKGWRASLSEKAGNIKKKIKTSYVNDVSDTYQKQLHMSKEEADTAAEKKAQMIKKIAIGAGVTIAAAAAFHAYRTIGREYVDRVIKEGTTIQNLQFDSHFLDDGKTFYASHRKLDNEKYIGVFGDDANPAFNSKRTDTKYKNEAIAAKDIKVAGQWEAKKVFNNLMKNNAEFRNVVNNKNGVNANDKKGYTFLHPFSNKYEQFIGIDFMKRQNDAKVDKAVQTFINELKKKGYGGVSDSNDTKFSGLGTQASILFDNLNNLKTKTEPVYGANGKMIGQRLLVDVKSTKLKDVDIDKVATKAHLIINADLLSKPYNIAAVALLGGSIAGSAYDSKLAIKQKKKEKEQKRKKKK